MISFHFANTRANMTKPTRKLERFLRKNILAVCFLQNLAIHLLIIINTKLLHIPLTKSPKRENYYEFCLYMLEECNSSILAC